MNPKLSPWLRPVSTEDIAFESKLASRLEPLTKIENVAVESTKDALDDRVQWRPPLPLWVRGAARASAWRPSPRSLVPLGEVDLDEYLITVEGHTDDTPIKTSRFPSNWELSASRATSVVRALVEGGLKRTQVSAMAFGDTRPLAQRGRVWAPISGEQGAQSTGRHPRRAEVGR